MDKLFTILYEEAAEDDLRAFRAYDVRRILDEVDAQLMTEPVNPSRRRNRVGDFRVFYDVDEERQAVIVRAIRHKGTRTTEEIL